MLQSHIQWSSTVSCVAKPLSQQVFGSWLMAKKLSKGQLKTEKKKCFQVFWTVPKCEMEDKIFRRNCTDNALKLQDQ